MHFYLNVNVFSTKVLIGDTIFTSPNGDGTAILRGHPSHAKVYPLAVQRKYLHFSVILRPWGIEPATSRSAVKRSTDWANPATVKLNWLIWNSDIILCFTHYFCLSSWLLKYLQFYPPSFYKNGELLGSLALFKMAAILNFAEKFIYLYIYIEIKLMNIDIWVRAK